MGFYGNITNTARTQFQFDKIYANRYEMVSGQATDGIYAGRYVLVEYDSEAHLDTFLQVIIDDDGYMRYGVDANTRLTYGNIGGREYVYISKDDGEEFYKIIYDEDILSTDYVKYRKIVDSNETTYTKNYNIDKAAYNTGRGYDSTVWQKMYVDNVEKYVMIAELNTVVPTFEVVADAPTMSPLIPHFDTQSTDVRYKLHWQSPWGFRVADAEKTTNDEGEEIQHTENYEYVGVSDETSNYTGIFYDADKDKTTTSIFKDYPAAIYYNKAGFNDALRTYDDKTINKVQISPTGKSGNKYNKHNGTLDTDTKEDIMELSITLPAIGNAICSVWDKLYGKERHQDIEWKFVEELKESASDMTYDISTLAGCINKVHELIGMIITKELPKSKEEIEEAYENHYIYLKEDGTYYRIIKKAEITSKKTDNEFSAHKNTGEYVYVLQEIEGLGNDLKTILGCLLEVREVLGNKKDENDDLIYDRDTVYGSINAINEIIDLFDDVLICGKFVIFNDNYKIKTADWTAIQDFSWKNFGNEETDLIENGQFINVSIDGEKNKITFEHVFHKVDDTRTDSDVNDNGDIIELYTPIVDNMGHVVGKNIETVTLPYGFKTIKASNTEDSEVSTPASDILLEGQVADNTQDTLTFAASNRWIKVDNATEDTVRIGHYTKEFDETTNETDFNDGNKTFDIQSINWDNAGHLVKSVKSTYTLPNSVKQIAIKNGGSNIDNKITTASDDDLIAETPIDTMTIDTGNRWIQLAADATNKKVSIYHNTAGAQAGTSQIGNETPKFGKTFLIPEIKYDNLGHIISTATHTVAIPEPSLNNLTATASSVITGLTLDTTEGKLIQTNANVGSLALTGYGNENTATAIAATDTINGAIRKLENQISNEINKREDADETLNKAITTEITNRNEAIVAAVNALDVDEISADNSYISSIKQINGKISASITALPDYSSYWNRINALEETIEQLTADLGTANDTIVDLQKSLNDLSTIVEQLSAKVDEYHPAEEDNTIEE